MHQRPRTILTLLLLALLAAACPARADEIAVRFEVSAKETVIGVPVVLSIAIDNAKSFDAPAIPAIDGAAVQPVPGSNRSSMTQIINGRVSQRDTVTYTYRVVPSRSGLITIPPITVTADGRTFTSDAFEIAVTKSETGDLLFVDVQADSQSVYVGQALPVTLRIWIRPYQDRRLNVRLEADDMFNLIDFKASEWGEFSDELPKLRDGFGQLRMRWREELRADSQGNKRSYYLYQIPTVIWPQQAGRVLTTPPRIVMTYPVRLGRSDAFLGMGSLSLAESKPLAVTADLPDFNVKAPPTEGRPATFTGAVGQFDIVAGIKPTDVSVGDPMTLTMTVTDRTPSPGARIDLLPPPALDQVRELGENFKMPSDPLAGSVRERTKTFTQTLRAKGDKVTRVPPIPFTYFDPVAEKYITRSTDALPIKVKASSQLAMNAVVGTTVPENGQGNGSGPRGTDLTEVAGGILANDGNIEAMLATQQFRMGWMAWIALAAPPLLCATLTIRRWSAQSRMSNAVAMRRRSAKKRALGRIKSSTGGDVRAHAQATAGAVCDYIADRFDLPVGTLVGGDVVALLRQRGAPVDIIREVDGLLEECEQMVYAGGSAGESSTLSHRARATIDHLERSRLR